ncbi:SGNH/GDSL hydrolase family protein [Ramlibacter humi]|nr:GDSL-type esterase/lipase family protein [Ramlibacter humi]
MNRREVTALLATFALAACGGGGSDTGALASGGTTALRPPATPSISLWGDSLIPPLSVALQMDFPDRQIFNGGVAGDTSSQVLQRFQADTTHRDWITVFWFGHNNLKQDASSAAQVKADLAAMVAGLAPGNDDFVVLSILNDATLALRGTALYDIEMALNADLQALYPAQYLDIRSLLVAQGDAADQANDVPASMFRVDEIHLNGAGSQFAADRIKALFNSRGW